MKVFVYGTLKKGYGNHHLLRNCPGEKGFLLNCELYANDNLPFVKKGSGMVRGEIYDIDETTLHRLDILEGHPRFYRREQVESFNQKFQRQSVWVYLFDDAARFPRVESGEWRG